MSKVDDNEEVGIGGFTALARVREQVTKTANVPSTPLEDGSFANDHIILNPLQISIEGKVADIFIKPAAETSIFRRNVAEIGNITKYATPQTQSQANKIVGLVVDIDNYRKRVQAAITDGRQAFEFFGSKDAGSSFREQFIEMLDGYYESKTVMRIELRDKIYENMVITSRIITTDNKTDVELDFKITAQQLRFAEVVYSDTQQFFKKPAPGSVGDQSKAQESKGLNDAPEKDVSLLSSVRGAFQ